MKVKPKAEICNTCRTPIYKEEVVYNSETKIGRNAPLGYGQHWENWTNWVQCAWCYDQWQIELAEYNRKAWDIWKWGWLINGFASLGCSATVFIWIEKIKSIFSSETGINPINPRTRWEQTIATFFIVIIFILLLTWIVRAIVYPSSMADRYKMRNRDVTP